MDPTIMVQLPDTTYATLQARARMTEELQAALLASTRMRQELEAEILLLKAEQQAQKGDERAIEILRLQAENQHLREKLGLSVRRLFGPSSERRITGQEALLFNEAEAEAVPNAPEPLTQVAAYVRAKKKSGQRALQLGGLAIEEVVHELPAEEQVCPQCAGHLHHMGEEERVEIQIIPAQITVVKHLRAKYTCRSCQKEAEKTPVLAKPLPPTAFPGSLASPSAVAYLMYEKYVQGCPLYRQEKDFERMGFPLSRQTMANWVIAGACLLDRVYVKLQERLLKEEILHADETLLQVLNEPGRPPSARSFMWLYRTGRYGPPIVLYDYQPTRGREHPSKYLKDFTGYLQVDGYPGYEKLPNITLAGCWAHARRKFVDALALLPAEKRTKGGTKAHEGLAFCDRLFALERELHEAAPQDRHLGREQRSRPVLAAFRTWLDQTAIDALPKSPIGEAVSYCIRQWSKLTAFLEDGRLEIDNNRAERSIKPFVTGRKNWLFANTPTGADASATVYSIVETAKENNLDPLKYLTFLFEQLPLVGASKDKRLDALMPWADEAQTACKITSPSSKQESSPTR
ncbi:MAG: IS66 family transposase [Acidobacteriaceae bacterium]